MSKSGVYIYDKDKQKVVKISDNPRPKPTVVGRVDEPYFDVGLDSVVKGQNHKRDLLKRRNLSIK